MHETGPVCGATHGVFWTVNEAVSPWTLVVVEPGAEVVVVEVELGPLELPQPTPASVSIVTTATCRANNDNLGAFLQRAQR